MIIVFNAFPVEAGVFPQNFSPVFGRAATSAAEALNEIYWLLT